MLVRVRLGFKAPIGLKALVTLRIVVVIIHLGHALVVGFRVKVTGEIHLVRG